VLATCLCGGIPDWASAASAISVKLVLKLGVSDSPCAQ
jgi:hypothetical protein